MQQLPSPRAFLTRGPRVLLVAHRVYDHHFASYLCTQMAWWALRSTVPIHVSAATAPSAGARTFHLMLLLSSRC